LRDSPKNKEIVETSPLYERQRGLATKQTLRDDTFSGSSVYSIGYRFVFQNPQSLSSKGLCNPKNRSLEIISIALQVLKREEPLLLLSGISSRFPSIDKADENLTPIRLSVVRLLGARTRSNRSATGG
jgi:hypothetical protein